MVPLHMPTVLPEGVAPAKRRSLFTGTAFEITDWSGVGLMILGFQWIAKG